MTTYGRATCVERSVNMFLNQDYKGDTELIIFNTSPENPYILDFEDSRIKIVNNGFDYITKNAYNNVGAIRRDALTHATGTHYICWDDDDIFLPWNIRMCVEGLKTTNTKAWKPIKSFFALPNEVKLVQNTLEASVIVDIQEVREGGFHMETGSEHLAWYTRLRNLGQLDENNTNSVPGYCFNWGDTGDIAPHKQSGDINNPNNFENHKTRSLDFPTKPIQKINIDYIYKPYFEYFKTHKEQFNENYLLIYVLEYL